MKIEKKAMLGLWISVENGVNRQANSDTSVKIARFCIVNNARMSAKGIVLFKKWVLEGQTLKVLSRDSGYSQRTLQTLFYKFLAQAPVLKIQNNRVLHMRIDGTYFNQFCLISYQDYHSNYTQLIKFSDEERYEEIKEDLQNLLRIRFKD